MKNPFSIYTGKEIQLHAQWVSYDQFKELFTHPTWYYFTQIIKITRSYEEGLGAGIHLLNLNDYYINLFTKKEYNNNVKLLSRLCLEMLDKLDRWEEFLIAFDEIWNDKRFHFRCHKKKLTGEWGYMLSKGVVSEKDNYVYVHDFYEIADRREIVKRKIQRKKKGYKMGNMYHHTKNDLTDKEINYRCEWLNDLIKAIKTKNDYTRK